MEKSAFLLKDPSDMPSTPDVPSCWSRWCCEDTSLTPAQVALYIAVANKILIVNTALEKHVEDMIQQDKYVNAFLVALIAIEPTSEDKELVRAVKTVKRLVKTAKNLKNLVDEFRAIITDLECALIAMNKLQKLIALFEGIATGATQQAAVDAISTDIQPNLAERLIGFIISFINFFHLAFNTAKGTVPSATAAPAILNALDKNAVSVKILAGLIAVVKEISSVCENIHVNCCLCAHYFAVDGAVSESRRARYYALLATHSDDVETMQAAVGKVAKTVDAMETLTPDDNNTIQRLIANPKATLQTVLSTIGPIIKKLMGLFSALEKLIHH